MHTLIAKLPFTLGAVLVFSSTLTSFSCTTLADRTSQPPQTISLAQSVHFTSPEGGDVIAEPGLYRLEIAAASQLRLVSVEGGEGKAPVLIEAVPATLGEPLPTPVALYLPWKDDEHHFICFSSNGNGLEAIGSTTGVRSRAASLVTLGQPQLKSNLLQMGALGVAPTASTPVPGRIRSQGTAREPRGQTTDG